MFKRNSHPPTSIGGTKAESKLKSVLTAIDESYTRQNNGSNASEKDANSPDTPTNQEIPGGINGLTRSTPDKPGQTCGDGSDRIGSLRHNSFDTDDESDNETSPTTPTRRSFVFIPTSADPPSPTLKGHEREASRTPTAEPVELPP